MKEHPVAAVHDLDALLRTGIELSHTKRFAEAEPIFRQVLTLEPRHTGAAYMLSLCLYFTGQFHQVLPLFGQLSAANSPLDSTQKRNISELSRYAEFETLRLNYWEKKEEKEGQKVEIGKSKGMSARLLSRAGKVLLLPDFTDVDDAIGANVEAVDGRKYELIPFHELVMLEFGIVKRWISAQLVYRDGSRLTIQTPMTYRDSMRHVARGVREGLETVIQPHESSPSRLLAVGQKQFRSGSLKIPLSEIQRIEF